MDVVVVVPLVVVVVVVVVVVIMVIIAGLEAVAPVPLLPITGQLIHLLNAEKSL